MSSMSDALRTIIAGSPDAAGEAIDCLRAITAKSPVVQQRFNRVLSLALNDPQATFTAADRTVLAAYAALPDDDEPRSVIQPIRLSPSERLRLSAAAQAEGVTLSTYIRRRLGLE